MLGLRIRGTSTRLQSNEQVNDCLMLSRQREKLNIQLCVCRTVAHEARDPSCFGLRRCDLLLMECLHAAFKTHRELIARTSSQLINAAN